MANQNPIGVFDSGIGGLTVVKAIKERLPNEKIIYFGDTAHLPYGDKSAHAILNYANQITSFLYGLGCKAIVIACNSASTVASKSLEKAYSGRLPIINVIDPTVDFIINGSAEKVGLIGTKRTISSKVYQRRIAQKSKHIKLFSKATPLLAPMIEEGFFNNSISKTIINNYLSSSNLNDIDTLILGCTHYPLIKTEVANYYQKPLNIVDSSAVTANYLHTKLKELNLINTSLAEDIKDVFYVSDYTNSFEKAAKIFFGRKIDLVESRLFS